MMRGTSALLLAVGLLVVAACGVAGPKLEIVGVNARDGFSGFDYVVWVDCTVRNSGRDGNIEVVAELQAGGSWIKRETVLIAKNEERKVTIAFPEPDSFFSVLGSATYNCNALPK